MFIENGKQVNASSAGAKLTGQTMCLLRSYRAGLISNRFSYKHSAPPELNALKVSVEADPRIRARTFL